MLLLSVLIVFNVAHVVTTIWPMLISLLELQYLPMLLLFMLPMLSVLPMLSCNVEVRVTYEGQEELPCVDPGHIFGMGRARWV